MIDLDVGRIDYRIGGKHDPDYPAGVRSPGTTVANRHHHFENRVDSHVIRDQDRSGETGRPEGRVQESPAGCLGPEGRRIRPRRPREPRR